MAISETGHSKNVANFETLLSGVQSFGAAYNPSRNNLKIPALTPLPGSARDFINEVNTFANQYSVAVTQREAAFDGLGTLVTRVMSALELSDASADAADRARTLARKLQGRRAGERTADDPATPDVDESEQNHSVSQMSFDNRLANFEAFVQLLEAQGAAYAPNETELQADTLRTRADQMRTRNTAVTSAQTALEAARISRNNILYHETTGLVAIAADVKKYVKSAFGQDSPQYAQIKDLKFTTPR
jgi:nucleotide-binding universal stress UspA family protein